MEKIWAKLHKSYQASCFGHSYEVFRDLLGCPSFYRKTNDENIFENLKFWVKKNFLVTSTSSIVSSDQKALLKRGIMSYQTYSILEVALVPDRQGKKVNIIKLRNPFGNFEWNGDWGDESECWTEEAKRMVNLVVADDGIFWMSFDDFKKNFISIHIGMYSADCQFNFLKIHEEDEITDTPQPDKKPKQSDHDR